MSEVLPEAPPVGTRPDPGQLGRYLDGEHHDIREGVRGVLSTPEFKPVWGMERGEYRDHVMDLMRKRAETGSTAIGFPKEYGGQNDVAGAVVGFETLGPGGLSLLVKCGVQFGLFGGAIL